MEDNNIEMFDGNGNYNSNYLFPYSTSVKQGEYTGNSSSIFAWAIETGLIINPKNYIKNEVNGDGLTLGNVSDISFYEVTKTSVYGVYNDGSLFL